MNNTLVDIFKKIMNCQLEEKVNKNKVEIIK